MRFMVLVKADQNSEAGIFPDGSEKLLTEMGNYNEQLMKAGVLLAAEGLHPTSKGARVKFRAAFPGRRGREAKGGPANDREEAGTHRTGRDAVLRP